MACWNTVSKGGWTAVVIVNVKDFLAESCFNNNNFFVRVFHINCLLYRNIYFISRRLTFCIQSCKYAICLSSGFLK